MAGRICVDPDALRAIADELRRASDSINTIQSGVAAAVSRLDLEVRARAGVEAQLTSAASRAKDLVSKLDASAIFLRNKAATFEAADREGAVQLNEIAAKYYGAPTPFVGGPSVFDIRQGKIGDCGLIAALGALAYAQPEVIRRAIRDNGDGTYVVTLYSEGIPHEVTVSGDFNRDPKEPDEVYATRPNGNEIWVPLIEKAVVQVATGGNSTVADYEKISAIPPGMALELLTGQPSESVRWMDVAGVPLPTSSGESVSTAIEKALATDRPITVGIEGNLATLFLGKPMEFMEQFGVEFPKEFKQAIYGVGDSGLVRTHAFVVTGIEDGEVTLVNPWGDAEDGSRPASFTVSIDVLTKFGKCLDIGAAPVRPVDTALP